MLAATNETLERSVDEGARIEEGAPLAPEFVEKMERYRETYLAGLEGEHHVARALYLHGATVIKSGSVFDGQHTDSDIMLLNSNGSISVIEVKRDTKRKLNQVKRFKTVSLQESHQSLAWKNQNLERAGLPAISAFVVLYQDLEALVFSTDKVDAWSESKRAGVRAIDAPISEALDLTDLIK